MANFDNIIQEINTNLPDNNTQSITAAKLRTTLIDLTNTIDTVQDDFETEINNTITSNIVDNLNSTDTNKSLSANQGKVLKEAIDDVSNHIFTKEYVAQTEIETMSSVSINSDGTFGTTSSNRSGIKKYEVNGSTYYQISGRCPTADNLIFAWYNSSDTFISGENPFPSTNLNNYQVVSPTNAKYVRIFYNSSAPAKLELINFIDKFAEESELQSLNNELTHTSETASVLGEVNIDTFKPDYGSSMFGAVNGNNGTVNTSILDSKFYKINIPSGYKKVRYTTLRTDNPSRIGLAFYNSTTTSTTTFISGKPYIICAAQTPYKSLFNIEIEIPDNAVVLCVMCNDANVLNENNFYLEFINVSDNIMKYYDVDSINLVASYQKAAINTDGVFTSLSSTSNAVLREYKIDATKTYKTSIYNPSAAYVGIGCWSDIELIPDNYLGTISSAFTKSAYYNGNVYILPNNLIEGTKYITVHTVDNINMNFVFEQFDSNPPLLTNLDSNLDYPVSKNAVLEIVSTEILPSTVGNYYITYLGGETSTNTNYQTNTYTDIDVNEVYYATGACPSTGSSNVFVYYFDENENPISYEKPISVSSITNVNNYQLNIPTGTKIIKVCGRTDTPYNLPKLVKKNQSRIDYEGINSYYIPMIYNNSLPKKSATDTLKIMCFGSSWFMDTWWYLNKLLHSAGISAELHCYYMGHSEFKEWIQLYNNDLTPFAGSESSRSASKNIAIVDGTTPVDNTSDWTKSNYSSSGSYNAQSYRDDFYNDLTSKQWDLIITQQGAQQGIYWEEWTYYSDLISIVKRNCNSHTVIGFNSTWTQPIVSPRWPYSGPGNPTTAEGQKMWQIVNYANTKKFMMLTGINNVIPNGALMWALRHNATLNTGGTDMADDGCHPNNGIPVYGLGMNLFATYISPMYDKEIENINWLPDSSTQKASVSGSSFMPISNEQRTLILEAVHLSQSDKFGFRTL